MGDEAIPKIRELSLQPTPPPTPDVIKKLASLMLIDAFRKRATRIRWEVTQDGGGTRVSYCFEGGEHHVMHPPPGACRARTRETT